MIFPAQTGLNPPQSSMSWMPSATISRAAAIPCSGLRTPTTFMRKRSVPVHCTKSSPVTMKPNRVSGMRERAQAAACSRTSRWGAGISMPEARNRSTTAW
jgi:hypothetical protein